MGHESQGTHVPWVTSLTDHKSNESQVAGDPGPIGSIDHPFTHVSVRVGPEGAEVLAQHPPDVGPHDAAAAIHVEVCHLH